MTSKPPRHQQSAEPWVIVVIPAHNEGDTVAQVVTGIGNAIHCEVVVDDASTDHTSEAARQGLSLTSAISTGRLGGNAGWNTLCP